MITFRKQKVSVHHKNVANSTIKFNKTFSWHLDGNTNDSICLFIFEK